MLRTLPAVNGITTHIGTLEDVTTYVHAAIATHPDLQNLTVSERSSLPDLILQGITEASKFPFSKRLTNITLGIEWREHILLTIYVVAGQEFYPRWHYNNSQVIFNNTAFRIVPNPDSIVVGTKPTTDCLGNYKSQITVGTKFTFRAFYLPTLTRQGQIQFSTFQSSNWQVQEITSRGVILEHPGGGHRHLHEWDRELLDVKFLA